MISSKYDISRYFSLYSISYFIFMFLNKIWHPVSQYERMDITNDDEYIAVFGAIETTLSDLRVILFAL